MKIKRLFIISVLSLGVLCACRTGTDNTDSKSNLQSSVVNTTNNNTSRDPIHTSTGGQGDPATSDGGQSTTSDGGEINTQLSDSSSQSSSKEVSNPFFDISNDEGGMASWKDA